jgi:hypothetical protein
MRSRSHTPLPEQGASVPRVRATDEFSPEELARLEQLAGDADAPDHDPMLPVSRAIRRLTRAVYRVGPELARDGARIARLEQVLERAIDEVVELADDAARGR